jgi:hypothetical protein
MSSINLNTSNVYSSGLQQKSQSVLNLFSALQDGDLKKAQKAYASSGLPVMDAKNTNPLGRLYNSLRNEDLKGAQQAGLDMQGKNKNKKISNPTPQTTNISDPKAMIKAAALEIVKNGASNSSLSMLLGKGKNIDTWG